MRRAFFPILALGPLLIAIPTKAQPDTAVVATRTSSGVAATQLLSVDLTSGSIASLGRFASDTLPPLAVEVDEVNGDIVLALDAPPLTHIVRLDVRGGAIVAERTIAQVSGRVIDIGFWRTDRLVLTVEGATDGVFDLPRNGGSPTLVVAAPRAAAFLSSYPGTSGLLAQSGTVAPAGSGYAQLGELRSSGLLSGFALYGEMPRARVTGLYGQFAASWVLLGLEDGTLWETNWPTTSPPGTGSCCTPVLARAGLPAGGLVALDGSGNQVFGLGGSAHPFLETFTYGTEQPWVSVAGPLPGAPVDLDLTSSSASVHDFGVGCALVAAAFGTEGGLPRLGNASFGLTYLGLSVSPAAFVLGASDQFYLGQALPLSLPEGACPLLVSVDVAIPVTTGVGGQANLGMPIPAQASLVSTTLFAQVIELQVRYYSPFPTTVLSASEAAAIHIGR